jgi:hypothetical protein
MTMHWMTRLLQEGTYRKWWYVVFLSVCSSGGKRPVSATRL